MLPNHLAKCYLLCVFQVDQLQNTDNRISQMFDLTFQNTSGDEEKRKQVCNCLKIYHFLSAFVYVLFTHNIINMQCTEQLSELQIH